jgi:dTDP-4-amino-4,6-dideoxygalactose transaminase
MCVTSDPGLADTLRKLRVHGIRKRYHHEIHGYNTRLDELQAAILRVKWRFLESWNGRRSRIAGRYMEGLSGLPVELPVVGEGNEHVWHVFALLSDARDALQKHLADRGVPTLIYYPTPLHLQPCFADAGWGPGDFPVAESVARRILPLPMYPELTDAEVDWVVTSIRSFFGH